jgi:hypothetical protein
VGGLGRPQAYNLGTPQDLLSWERFWLTNSGNRIRLGVSIPETLTVGNPSAEMFQWKTIGKRRRQHTETFYAQQRWRRECRQRVRNMCNPFRGTCRCCLGISSGSVLVCSWLYWFTAAEPGVLSSKHMQPFSWHVWVLFGHFVRPRLGLLLVFLAYSG